MRILIFDDDLDALYLYKKVLEKKGHTITHYPNCSRILDIVSWVQPDIIIMDDEMPGLTGKDALHVLKANTQFSGIPIIFCSANLDTIENIAEIKADYFLPKPISSLRLEESLRFLNTKMIFQKHTRRKSE